MADHSETAEPRGCPTPGACSALAELERLRGENAKLAMMSKDCANRTAVTSLAFLAKIVRDIGYENRKQESNAEMIGRALRELSDGGRRWMSAEGPQSS